MTSFIISSSLNEICTRLGSFLHDDGFCDETIHKKLRTMSFAHCDGVLNMITGQSSIKSLNPAYSIYKINIFDEMPLHEVNLESNIGNSFHTTIQADGTFLFLNCLDVLSLMLFLGENSRDLNRYVFIPVIFSTEIHDSGHATMLVFDVISKKVYFADPNGKSAYFDNLLLKHAEKTKEDWMTEEIFREFYGESYINSENLIEKLITFYINELNTAFGLDYKFVKRSAYNLMCYSINGSYDKSAVIGSGHCMILSIMIAHYLSSNSDISDIFNHFGKLSIEEKVQLISSYSVGVYNIISQIA
jgi:hypothetical protein